MAVADIFLKIQGVTGEAIDPAHKGEIEVVSWSWGMLGSESTAIGQVGGKATIREISITKRVDQGSTTLMSFLYGHKPISKAQLTVRKAGGPAQLEYLKIEMENVRVTSMQLNNHTNEPQVDETVGLAFSKVRVSYTPQAATGAAGGGTSVFEADAHAGS